MGPARPEVVDGKDAVTRFLGLSLDGPEAVAVDDDPRDAVEPVGLRVDDTDVELAVALRPQVRDGPRHEDHRPAVLPPRFGQRQTPPEVAVPDPGAAVGPDGEAVGHVSSEE